MQTIEQVWTEYKATGNVALRNQLVENYLPLISRQAARLKKGTPPDLDYYDLKQDGVIGLIEAIEAFDPKRGIKFETYSQLRISGSMKDKVRDLDWVPRLVRDRYKRICVAVEKLTVDLDRKPTRVEIAHHLDISTTTLDAWLDKLPVEMRSFSTYEKTDQDANPIYKLAVKHEDNPSKIVEDRDYREHIGRGLDRTDKLMVNLFIDGQRPVDVARAAGVSQTSISNRRHGLLEKLQDKGISIC
jgi:RNA polymerase sigma factor for flagellar operon FliA